MSRGIKRAMDVAIAGIGLLILSPVMGGVAIAVTLGMGRPVLFRQRRPGHGGCPFELIKFRTMLDLRGPDGGLVTTGERTTRLGYILRRTSLDELPELWNILRGDMSLVGPRPLLMEYLPRYTPEQARRHEVRPGLTGLAQVKGRHLMRWEDRFELDVWYVDHWSLGLDLRILAATARMVVSGRGLPPRGTPDYEFHGSLPSVPATDDDAAAAGSSPTVKTADGAG